MVTLVAIGKARNGALAVMEQLITITSSDLLRLGCIALAVGLIAAMLALLSAKAFSTLVEHINYQWLCAGVLAFLFLLVALLSSWKGILVLMASTALGLLAPWLKTSRAHAMGCLLIPTLLYYL